ncbi:T9SS type A sorting domain-containing protein [Hymenobacter algoricola]|uniref:T9SS type A sorting domain-containing protein n=1 Tax=Hymenobacter algoricola TaxID=486267 RepID=A0ABP7N643_9BACT
MKTLLQSIRLVRWGIALFLLGNLSGCGGNSTPGHSWLEQSSRPAAGQNHRERGQAEGAKHPDRPDLAEAQEVALTRDPATGTVPRERLLVAREQVAQMLADRASQRAAVSGLGAANWTEKGPSNIAGRVRALLPDPADATGNKVWAGSVGGGLWKSVNAASATPTWSKINDLFSNLAISTITYDPANADIMYFGTGEGFGNADAIRGLGIWKSADHGVTWAQLASTNNSDFHYVQKIVVDKNGWVYAATRTGLRRSKDGGATWVGVLYNNSAGYGRFSDVDVHPTTGAVYASLGVFQTGGGILYSASGDAGTYTILNSAAGSGLPDIATHHRVELAIAPSDPSRLYAMFCSTTNTLLNIYRSSDGGTTWQVLPKPNDADPNISDADFTRSQAWYDLALAVSPTDPNTVFVGGIDIFKTSNGGAATPASVVWQQVTHWYGGFGFQNVHADQHAVAFVPGSGTHAYFANDGGIARTTTATATIPAVTPINTSFNITQFYAVAVHPTDYGYFLAGAQDNGTQQFRASTGSVTRDVNGGDGAFCAIDEENPDIQFATYVFSNVYRSTTKGDDFFPGIIEESDNGSFINPLEYDSRKNTLYYNYSTTAVPAQLRRARNATGTRVLTTIALPVGSGVVTHVAISPNVTNRVYVGTNAGRVIRIDSAATTPTFTTLFNYGSAVSISGIAVEKSSATPEPDQHILATIANYGAVSVQQTSNAGGAWASAEGNLPDMPVRWVLFDPTAGKRAMLATELGVWTTEDLTAASIVWVPSNTNLANVRVDMLRLRKADKTVVAATHGRGLFTSDIFAVVPLPVELTSFTGRTTDQGVTLRWETASERNSRAFEVERAPDGRTFRRLASVAAAGTSTTPHRYAYTDGAAPAGRSYYRLRQLDEDGTAAYSPIIAVAWPTGPPLLLSRVYPNPFRRELTLTLGQPAAAGTTVTVTDPAGRVAYRTEVAAGARQMALRLPAELAPGLYTLTVAQGKARDSHRLVKSE